MKKLLLTCASLLVLALLVGGCGHTSKSPTQPIDDPEPTCDRSLALEVLDPGQPIDSGLVTSWSYQGDDLVSGDSVTLTFSSPDSVVTVLVVDSVKNVQYVFHKLGLWKFESFVHLVDCQPQTTTGTFTVVAVDPEDPEMTCELTASLAEEVLFVGDRQVVVWGVTIENAELDSVLVTHSDSAGTVDSTVYVSGQQHAFYVQSPGQHTVNVKGFFGDCGVVSVGPMYFDVNIMPVGSATLVACPYYQLKDTTNVTYKVVRDDLKIKVAGKLYYQNWNMEQPYGPVYEVDWSLDFWLTIAHQQSGKILVWFEGQDELGQDVRTDGVWVYRVGEYQELRMWLDWPRDVSVGDSVLVRFGGYEAPDEALMQYLVSAETFTIIDGERVAIPFMDVDVEDKQFTFVFDTPGERVFAIVLHLDTDEDGVIDLIITGELLHVTVY